MKKELFYCDKCKKQVKKINDLKLITIEVGKGYYKSPYRYELCTDCVLKLKIYKKKEGEEKEIVKSSTLKDDLFDIICEIIQEETSY